MVITQAELTHLLDVVFRWAKKMRLTDEQIVTAKSLAWNFLQRHEGERYADSHWARLACRHVRNGRDLAGCGTSPADALCHSVQGAAMGELSDKTPPPNVLAEHRELMERLLDNLSEGEMEVVSGSWQGLTGNELAERLNRSISRISQLKRSAVQKWND